jgi:hypothetical protein
MNESGLPAVPENSSAPALIDLGLALLHEVAKVAAVATGDPSVAATVDASGGVFKATRDYWRARQGETGNEFLRRIREMLLRHEEVLKRLMKEDSPEPLANTFATIFHAAINDDELAKAKFYAAFMVGCISRSFPIAQKVMLLDAMRRLRAHEIYVLLLFSRSLEQQAGLAAFLDFTGRPRFNIGIQPAEGSAAAAFMSFPLTGQAISALAGCGLMVQQSNAAPVGVGAGNITYHMGPQGSRLSKMILDNLDDIEPIAVLTPRKG